MAKNFYERYEPTLFSRIARDVGKNRNVIEIGCGDCRLCNHLARKNGCTTVGIDINDVDFSRARVESRRLHISHLVECIKVDAEKLSRILNKKFDFCLSLYVLHELRNPIKVLKEVRAILKEKGKVIFVDFPEGSLAEQLWDEKYYSVKEMKTLFKRAGFKKIGHQLLARKQLVYLTALR
ncbi:hypothetical protein BXT86_05620 [candidate division WOR-3 bacterium 4484_100]|uniref:Methyltransferase type 11 domain-containing protein n=1 Tax=candidate division WOR-3 bacterium 4484_100 TaxID=1936077 RepID=A0A1V4QFU3_UNCW3|nr:MAG: hypothetical protein BXT86_05620 [candidate division WOR-3 bacterium 4484_100]